MRVIYPLSDLFLGALVFRQCLSGSQSLPFCSAAAYQKQREFKWGTINKD